MRETHVYQPVNPNDGSPLGPPIEMDESGPPLSELPNQGPSPLGERRAGGPVRQKSWQRALAQHRRIQRAATRAARPKGNW